MFTFPETEKFHVLNPKNSDDIHLNVLQRGNLDFYTFNTHWMQLKSNGNLGLSNDEWSLFSPDEQLHQNNKESADLWHHFTNKTTGLGGNKGFERVKEL